MDRAQVICSYRTVRYSLFLQVFIVLFVSLFCHFLSLRVKCPSSFVNTVQKKRFTERNESFQTPMYIDLLATKRWYYFVVFFQRLGNKQKSEEIYFYVFSLEAPYSFSVMLIFNRNCINFDFFSFYNDRICKTLSNINLHSSTVYKYLLNFCLLLHCISVNGNAIRKFKFLEF